MNQATLLALEQTASWGLGLLWAFLCVFAFPAQATGMPGQTHPRMPFVSWVQMERSYDPAKEIPFEGIIGKVRTFRLPGN